MASTEELQMKKPSPHELWAQAVEETAEMWHGQEREDALDRRYRGLMREHGYLVDRKPGDDPNLPCGWPGDRNV
jgi:hypothetical protein